VPRRKRVFVEGGIYHVYNRAAHGAAVFDEEAAAEGFLEHLRSGIDAGGHRVLAYCLMSNHFHVLIVAGGVPIWRCFATVQARFGVSRNRRLRSSGPTWQSRYKAKLVEDEGYLQQLIAYIHLNPVSAGLVDDPADYPWSGHQALIARKGDSGGLIDVDRALSLYGDTLVSGRKSYLESLKSEGDEATWLGEMPGRLPWWRRVPDRDLEVAALVGRDLLGRTTGLVRIRVDAEQFIEAACQCLDLESSRLASGARTAQNSRLRWLVAGVGAERWRVGTKSMARVLGRKPGVVTGWIARAAQERCEDPEFASAYEQLDQDLARNLLPTDQIGQTQHDHIPPRF
jgi:putative transposase